MLPNCALFAFSVLIVPPRFVTTPVPSGVVRLAPLICNVTPRFTVTSPVSALFPRTEIVPPVPCVIAGPPENTIEFAYARPAISVVAPGVAPPREFVPEMAKVPVLEWRRIAPSLAGVIVPV